MRWEEVPEHFNLPGWGSLLPLLLQGRLEGRFAITTQKFAIVC